jgi:hypothetical protein
MARSCADMREAQLLQEFSDVALVGVDAEPLGDDPLEVDASPTHHPILLAIRSRLDDGGEFSRLLSRQARLGPSVQLAIEPSGPASLNR